MSESPALENNRYMIFWSWMPRLQTPDEIEDRMRNSVAALATIDPAFGDWQVLDLMDLLNSLSRGRSSKRRAPPRYSALGEPSAGKGFMTMAAKEVNCWPVPGLSLLCANGIGPRPLGMCGTMFYTDDTPTPDPALVSYRMFKSIAMALVPVWDASFAQVYPQPLRPQGSGKPGAVFGPCWMIYLDKRLAQRITPTSDIVAEPTSDGGVFLAATDATFDVSDPAHVAAAKRLAAVLAPLDA